MEILDGKEIANKLQGQLKLEIAEFSKNNKPPKLSVVMIGENSASKIYVKKKQEACNSVGIISEVYTNINSYNGLSEKIYQLNECPDTHGILVQLPLPIGYSTDIFEKINVWKDVDVFNPTNMGLLVQGNPRFKPCTPHGIQLMLKHGGIQTAGKRVVVINRSNIVGRPLSSMLIQDNEYANATVTVCHDNTPPKVLREVCLESDIIVVAVGKPGFLTSDMVKCGSTVIDVGITRIGNRVVGDVDFENVSKVAGAMSKVPGGVGCLTVYCLLENTFLAAKALQNV